MSKNKLGNLNDHLFAALERLGDEALTPDQIESEAKRASAIVAVADQITENARTRLQGARLFAEHGTKILPGIGGIGGSQQEQIEHEADQ